MKTIQESRLQILDWEKDNRNINNRSTNECSLCSYAGPIGCAIGRLVVDKDLCRTMDQMDDSAAAAIFYMLPGNVQELGEDFLSIIQDFHDATINWDEDGLTSRGMERYDYIKMNYCS
jgi:hypothetical protein